MSTYNGQSFLQEQLDSLLNQKDVLVNILIRDDGSNDNTKTIIKETQASHDRIFIRLIEGQNIGWRESFFELVKIAWREYSEYDFFAFCDQDDVWMPQKLKSAYTKLIKMPEWRPRLYCSNLMYFKGGINYGIIRNIPKYPDLKQSLIRNYATGCTIVFDKNLLSLVACNLPKIEVAHDWWFYLVSVSCGNVYIDNESFILYRQHENNQIGLKKDFFQIWRRRLCSNILRNHQRELQARELLRLYSMIINDRDIKSIEELAYYKNKLRNKIYLLLDNGFTTNLKSNDFWLKIKIILGIV